MAQPWRNPRRARYDDRRPKWWQIPEWSDDEPDYDRFAMMMKIDTMAPEWRALVNAHGFTAVIQTMMDTADVAAARAMLQRRHEARQMQLAYGRV